LDVVNKFVLRKCFKKFGKDIELKKHFPSADLIFMWRWISIQKFFHQSKRGINHFNFLSTKFFKDYPVIYHLGADTLKA